MDIREIDKTSQDDIRRLAELFREYAADIERNLSPTIATELSGIPCFRGFMAFDRQQPIAFCVLYETYSTYRSRFVWNIHDVMVSQSVRGSGIGRRLLDFVLTQAHQYNVAKVTLEVEDGNRVAKNLYESLGFQDYRVKAPSELHWVLYTNE